MGDNIILLRVILVITKNVFMQNSLSVTQNDFTNKSLTYYNMI